MPIQEIQCILDYPKGVIEKMLSDGAQEFPKVQFEMKSPTTMIMVGFNQQCKRHYGSTPEEPQATNTLWTACMTTKFGTTDVEDVENVCSHYTINKMHKHSEPTTSKTQHKTKHKTLAQNGTRYTTNIVIKITKQ